MSGTNQLQAMETEMTRRQQLSAMESELAKRQSAQPQMGKFESALTGFNTGAGNLAHGVLQPVLENVLGDKVKQASKQVAANRQAEYKLAQQANPLSTLGGNIAGGIAASSPTWPLRVPALGASLAGKIAGHVLTGSTQGGLQGAGQYIDKNDSRLFNTAVGVGLGGVSYPLAKGLSSPNPFVKAATGALAGTAVGSLAGGNEKDTIAGGIAGLALPFAPGVAKFGVQKLFNKITGNKTPIRTALNDAAALNILEGVDQKAASETKAAGDRLGLGYITPGEATGSPVVAAREGALGTSKEGGKLLFEKGQARLNSEKKSITDLYDVIHPRSKEMLQEETDLYNKANSDSISINAFNSLTKDPVINNTLKKMENIPAYQKDLKDISPSNIKYLDYAKRSLDDQIESASKSGEKNLARLLKDSKNKLVSTMDEASESYPKARELARRRLTRENLEGMINKGETTGTNFYSKILKNDKKFNKVMSQVKDIPMAQEKLSDMRMAFKNLVNPVTTKRAASQAQTEIGKKGGTFHDEIYNMGRKLLGGHYDKAQIELITNPHWDKEFSRIAKIKDSQEKALGFGNLLSKITTTGGIQQVSQK